MHVRQPDCTKCPLAGQPIVWGTGPLDAEILVVAESPGAEEEKAEVPLVGTTGRMVNALLRDNHIERSSIRIENTYQCKAEASSKKGKAAAKQCGPSLRQIVDHMPNLRLVIAFGDPALRWVSGYADSEAANKAAIKHNQTVPKKTARAQARYEKALTKWSTQRDKALSKGKPFTKAEPCLETLEGNRPVPGIIGWKGISEYRGSPLRLPYRRDVLLVPIIHPAATLAFRSPRLRPLLGLDARRAFGFYRGERTTPPADFVLIRDAQSLENFFRNLPGGPVALDIEYSRKKGRLVCIGLGGPKDLYCIIPFAEPNGWVLHHSERSAILRILQREFDNPSRQWGGHFACGYDERKLRENGLALVCQWDTLYGFHIAFSELGSARDEESVKEGTKKFSQSTGYDLGFVSSVLTDFPYHKGVVTYDIDALDVESQPLWTYCTGDVARTYHSWLAIQKEFDSEFANPQNAYSLLATEMDCARRATRMSIEGIPIIEEERVRRLATYESQLAAKKAEAVRIVGRADFNLNSNHQLARELIAQGVKGIRFKSETGNPQLDGRQLQRLLEKHPGNMLLQLCAEMRAIEKEIVAYNQLAPDWKGLAHPSWKVHGTSGPRWSSSNPNAQNLSKKQREVIG